MLSGTHGGLKTRDNHHRNVISTFVSVSFDAYLFFLDACPFLGQTNDERTGGHHQSSDTTQRGGDSTANRGNAKNENSANNQEEYTDPEISFFCCHYSGIVHTPV